MDGNAEETFNWRWEAKKLSPEYLPLFTEFLFKKIKISVFLVHHFKDNRCAPIFFFSEDLELQAAKEFFSQSHFLLYSVF